MAGRTSLMSDKGLNLYRGQSASPPTEMWVGLFTTRPTADAPLAANHGGIEWGPARVRIYPDSGSGSPFWDAPQDESATVRVIKNGGSLVWLSITLTTSPSTVVAWGLFDASTGDNLLTWGDLTESKVVADGEDHVIGTGDLSIKGG